MKPKLVPAILSDKLEDYLKFTLEYDKLNSTSIHLDIMDGVYVSSKSPNLEDIIEVLEENTNKIHTNFSIHLMVKDVLGHIKLIVDANSRDLIFTNLVYVHVDAITEEEFNFIKDEVEISLVLNPDTEIEKYLQWIKQCKSVMVMTVRPGGQGNPFLPESLNKIKDLRDLEYRGEIHLDGGLNEDTMEEVLKYSADVLNIGSAVERAENPREAYMNLYKILNN